MTKKIISFEEQLEKNRQKKLWMRRYNLKKVYNLSMLEYELMIVKQEGRCAICGTPESTKRLSVDHCHKTKTKTVRGLLCTQCNVAIGLFKENPQILLKAIEYLKPIDKD